MSTPSPPPHRPLGRTLIAAAGVIGFAFLGAVVLYFATVTETRSTSTPRVKAFRRRQSWGIHCRSINVYDGWLNALEKRGYLDPERRGDRRDECDAIEMFLWDSLVKSS